MSHPEISVLVPALNEAGRIEGTLERLLEYGAEHFERLEVIVVDDGSTDGTAELVRERFGDRVRVVRRPERGGKGAALRSGIVEATCPWTLFVDADLSIPIAEIEKLLSHTSSHEVVIGSKRAPGNDLEYPALRYFLGGLGQYLISFLVVRGFYDTQCGFKLYRTDVARELFRHQKIDGFGYDFELLFLAKRFGHSVAEVPVQCRHALGSTVRVSSYFDVLREVATLVWHRARGRYPKGSDQR